MLGELRAQGAAFVGFEPGEEGEVAVDAGAGRVQACAAVPGDGSGFGARGLASGGGSRGAGGGAGGCGGWRIGVALLSGVIYV